MPVVRLNNGIIVPAIGQGTWYLGDDPAAQDREIEAIRSGISAGMTLIDTAEMYGSGRSERLVGTAIHGLDRKKLFLVSKVLPSNAGRERIFTACENSIRRMGVEYLDLYLLHWIGSVPLQETVDCMEELRTQNLIRSWGVSNFDIDDMQALWQLRNGKNCLVNQVLYHTASRGIEYSLLPWMRRQGVALMAYCPLAQGGSISRGLFTNSLLRRVAEKHNVTVTQVLLAWNIRKGDTVAIPKSSRKEHTLLNGAAATLTLDEEDIRLIDQAYPPPKHKTYLDMQ